MARSLVDRIGLEHAVADLQAKHGFVRAGLGWGWLPEPLIAEDLVAGRLAKVRPSHVEAEVVLPFCLIRKHDTALGLAATGLVSAFTEASEAGTGR